MNVVEYMNEVLEGKADKIITYTVSHMFYECFFPSFIWKANRLKEVEGNDSFQAYSVKILTVCLCQVLAEHKELCQAIYKPDRELSGYSPFGGVGFVM